MRTIIGSVASWLVSAATARAYNRSQLLAYENPHFK
jgi:hypothetical protein